MFLESAIFAAPARDYGLARFPEVQFWSRLTTPFLQNDGIPNEKEPRSHEDGSYKAA